MMELTINVFVYKIKVVHHFRQRSAFTVSRSVRVQSFQVLTALIVTLGTSIENRCEEHQPHHPVALLEHLDY